jgi:transcriptional antiterminator NusG
MLVRIVEGPFAEFTGKIETVFEDKEMLRVMISLFGRDTPVEIEYSKVEKAE